MAEYIEKKGYCEYLATQEGDFLDDYGKGWSAAIAEARRIAEKFTVPPAYPVKDGETLCTGRHTLRFLAAPMVHWPEVLMTYDETDKLLLSGAADRGGYHGGGGPLPL